MATFREGVSNALRRATCRALGASQPSRDWARRISRSVPGSGVGFTDTADWLDRLERNACDTMPPGNPAGEPVFPERGGIPGGQCDGSRYFVDYTVFITGANPFNQNANGFWGPIEGAGINKPASGADTAYIICRGRSGGTSPPSPPGTQYQVYSDSGKRIERIEINSITPEAGYADDCGDLEPAGPPPPPVVPGPEFDYEDENGTPFTFQPNFEFSPPRLFPDGGIGFRVEYDRDGVKYCLDYNLANNTVSYCFGGEPGATGCCPAVDDIPTDSDEPPAEPTDEKRFVAVLVNVTGDFSNIDATVLGDGNGPDLYVPRLADISFAVKIGGKSIWTTEVPIKKKSSVIAVNSEAVAYAWDITSRNDLTFNVTPLYIKE